MTIADQAKALLTDPRLHALVDAQTERGTAKYGHTLDDYDAPQEVRLAHLVQDLLDSVQYALWCDRPYLARLLASELNALLNGVQGRRLDLAALLHREPGDA